MQRCRCRLIWDVIPEVYHTLRPHIPRYQGLYWFVVGARQLEHDGPPAKPKKKGEPALNSLHPRSNFLESAEVLSDSEVQGLSRRICQEAHLNSCLCGLPAFCVTMLGALRQAARQADCTARDLRFDGPGVRSAKDARRSGECTMS